MIEHLMRFDSEADAKADQIVGAYCIDDAWRGDVCFPGQIVWRPEDDTVTDEGDVVHHPLPYFYITITSASIDAELRDHPACMVVWDREANAPIFSRLTAEEMAGYVLEPVPAGSDYPFGGVS